MSATVFFFPAVIGLLGSAVLAFRAGWSQEGDGFKLPWVISSISLGYPPTFFLVGLGWGFKSAGKGANLLESLIVGIPAIAFVAAMAAAVFCIIFFGLGCLADGVFGRRGSARD